MLILIGFILSSISYVAYYIMRYVFQSNFISINGQILDINQINSIRETMRFVIMTILLTSSLLIAVMYLILYILVHPLDFPSTYVISIITFDFLLGAIQHLLSIDNLLYCGFMNVRNAFSESERNSVFLTTDTALYFIFRIFYFQFLLSEFPLYADRLINLILMTCLIQNIFFRVFGAFFTKISDISGDLVVKVHNKMRETEAPHENLITDLIGDLIGDCYGSLLAVRGIGLLILNQTYRNFFAIWTLATLIFINILVFSFINLSYFLETVRINLLISSAVNVVFFTIIYYLFTGHLLTFILIPITYVLSIFPYLLQDWMLAASTFFQSLISSISYLSRVNRQQRIVNLVTFSNIFVSLLLFGLSWIVGLYTIPLVLSMWLVNSLWFLRADLIGPFIDLSVVSLELSGNLTVGLERTLEEADTHGNVVKSIFKNAILMVPMWLYLGNASNIFWKFSTPVTAVLFLALAIFIAIALVFSFQTMLQSRLLCSASNVIDSTGSRLDNILYNSIISTALYSIVGFLTDLIISTPMVFLGSLNFTPVFGLVWVLRMLGTIYMSMSSNLQGAMADNYKKTLELYSPDSPLLIQAIEEDMLGDSQKDVLSPVFYNQGLFSDYFVGLLFFVLVN